MADEAVAETMVEDLVNLVPERVAATRPGAWNNYEVGDSTGLLVRVMGEKKELLGLIIGKFSYQQPVQPNARTGKLTTYIRRTDQEEVYAIDGFLRATFTMDIKSLRNKQLIPVGKHDIKRLDFYYPGDSSFIASLEKEGWSINGVLADSTAMAGFLDEIAFLDNQEFTGEPSMKKPSHRLTIEGDNMVSPIVVEAYVSESTDHYVISSSANPGTWFGGKGNDLFKKIFISGKRILTSG
jgi:hypothetical protein